MSWAKAVNAGAKTSKKKCKLCGATATMPPARKEYCRDCWNELKS